MTARELARRLYYEMENKAIALIDADRREVERQCAERVRNNRFIKLAGSDEWIAIPEWAIDAAIAAITSPAKEDTP